MWSIHKVEWVEQNTVQIWIEKCPRNVLNIISWFCADGFPTEYLVSTLNLRLLEWNLNARVDFDEVLCRISKLENLSAALYKPACLNEILCIIV